MQDPKYDFQNGRVINRASGEAIPEDEPVFVFRARDVHAADAIFDYYIRIEGGTAHEDAVLQRHIDFKDFAKEHPDRMKDPDTEPSR